jgi:hypothetical protein
MITGLDLSALSALIERRFNYGKLSCHADSEGRATRYSATRY